MLKSTPKPKKPVKVTHAKSFDIHVQLTEADYKAASLASVLSHESLPEWIASLVNTALMP